MRVVAAILVLVAFALAQDGSERHEIVIPIPTRLSVERTRGQIRVGFDGGSLQSVKVMAASAMIIGVRHGLRFWVEGDARPAEANAGFGYTRITEPVDPKCNLLRTTYSTGVPDGKSYMVEEDITIFETDIPPQHMWHPVSKNYKVLWEDRLKDFSEGQ